MACSKARCQDSSRPARLSQLVDEAGVERVNPGLDVDELGRETIRGTGRGEDVRYGHHPDSTRLLATILSNRAGRWPLEARSQPRKSARG